MRLGHVPRRRRRRRGRGRGIPRGRKLRSMLVSGVVFGFFEEQQLCCYDLRAGRAPLPRRIRRPPLRPLRQQIRIQRRASPLRSLPGLASCHALHNRHPGLGCLRPLSCVPQIRHAPPSERAGAESPALGSRFNWLLHGQPPSPRRRPYCAILVLANLGIETALHGMDILPSPRPRKRQGALLGGAGENGTSLLFKNR